MSYFLSTASLEDSIGLKTVPVPLEPEEDRHDDCSISPRQLHNLFYDGFYAPYMTNPDYILLLDARDEATFLERRLYTFLLRLYNELL